MVNCSPPVGTVATLCGQTKYLKDIVDKDIIFLIFFLTIIINNAAQSLNVLLRGREMAAFLTAWARGLREVGYATTCCIRLRLGAELLGTLLMLGLITHLEFAEVAFAFDGAETEDVPTHFVRDTIKSMMIITLQPFMADPRNAVNSTLCNGFYLMLMFYIFSSYKFTIFFYTYCCNTISESFKIWNRRAKRFFHPDGGAKEDGVTVQQLASQHFTLVQLVHDADHVFGLIITTYFVSLVGIIIFTIYEIILYSFGTMSLWLTVLIFLPSSLTLLTVAMAASEVAEAAAGGLEPVRAGWMEERGPAEDRALARLLAGLQASGFTTFHSSCSKCTQKTPLRSLCPAKYEFGNPIWLKVSPKSKFARCVPLSPRVRLSCSLDSASSRSLGPSSSPSSALSSPTSFCSTR
jgi:hypothetical protein